MQNAQWVKPLFPGDIPDNTTPIWDSINAVWVFQPIPTTPTPATPTPAP